ncbi:MAG: (Fe-S)-binding protein [Pseudomonadales bacterium]|nr:(Fe-S)-binding protein [Pseudomonadales bacterium]
MKTFLDWSAYKDAGMGDAYADIPKHGGDYAKSIAACINSQQCETLNKQVMCPSYKVTEDPALSTGGRVRALKAALSEDPAMLFQPDIVRAMELCVGCKGCKRECENNVDMALIKAEYLAQYRERFGRSLRSSLFAHLPRWLHRHSWLRHLVNLYNKSAMFANLTGKMLGLNDSISLPVPNKEPFQVSTSTYTGIRNVASSANDSISTQLPEVVLFIDTFSRYYEPDIVNAAIKVLRAGKYNIVFAEANYPERPLCCGRTYLAQGMIKEAREEALRLINVLQQHVEAGRLIVGLEASCVLGLRDDALALGLGDEAIAVSKKVFLLEEFLSKEIQAKRLHLPFKKAVAKKILIHGHCHQKAVGALKAMRRVIKNAPVETFSIIDSASCCGMAGTFGLEREHDAASAKMAAIGLLPAIKENPDSLLLANGFSCRHQINARSQAKPLHLAQFLASMMDRE